MDKQTKTTRIVSLSLPIHLADRLEQEENKSKTVATALSNYFFEQKLRPFSSIKESFDYFAKLRKEGKLKPFGSIEAVITAKNYGRE